jgi:hypothetical protein
MGKFLDGNEKKRLSRAVAKSGLGVGDRVYSRKGSRLGGNTMGVITGFTLVEQRWDAMVSTPSFPAAIVKKDVRASAKCKSRVFLLKNLVRE